MSQVRVLGRQIIMAKSKKRIAMGEGKWLEYQILLGEFMGL
jgi:hypothetical protein